MNRYESGMSSAPSLDHLYSPGTSPDEAPALVCLTVHELGCRLADSLALGCPSPASPSSLDRLRSELLVNGKLQLPALNRKLAEISTRASNLQLGTKYPLFAFPRVGLPFEDDEDRARSYVVPKPLDCSKAVLADLYQQKYGIHIVPVLAPRLHENYLHCVFRHLSAHQGQPMGFLLRVITDPDHQEVFDYPGHVLPLVIQQTFNGLDVINFNSLGEDDHAYKNFLLMLSSLVNVIPTWCVRSAMVNSRRQGDTQSCHTDAMQILKDALVQHKRLVGHAPPHTVNFFEQFSGLPPTRTAEIQETAFRLPSLLHKTTQRSAALLEDEVNFRLPVSRKGENLQSHREKYAGSFLLSKHVHSASESKIVNHFLTLKAYHNADRVLSKLESLSKNARKAYLDNLRQQW